ncbi:MAG TPA: sialate O-acetylesterase [Candidatus Saccharimonadales bacterium]|nr:sialate O-acetylesterase [Candidatus Saccharimonadales bacterium]
MHPKQLFSLPVLVAVMVAWAAESRSEVRLPGLFSDHMVLQIGSPIRLWGWADPGEEVRATCGGAHVKTFADETGEWILRLPPCKTGESFTITIKGKNTVTIKDAVMGEVWLASGQSNMEFALARATDSEKHIASSENEQIRLFTVPRLKSDKPVEDVKASWKLCGAPTVTNFSAVAYFFARDLQKARKVPVGIIHTSWGGSPAEVWMSDRVLSQNLDYKHAILDDYPSQFATYQKAQLKWEQEAAAAKAEGRTFTNARPRVVWKPSELYNGMIAPLVHYPIKGAIWYQGESNAGRAWQYRTLMADLIRNWRNDWGQEAFTFLEVQLAPYMQIKNEPSESKWAELREAQNIVASSVPKAGVAVITDVGEEKDIHPRQKEPVGARLARAARGIAYHENIIYSGPTYKRLTIKGDRAVVSFDNTGSGLQARGGELKGFAICGEDKRWVWGKATIQGDNVVVTSPEVSAPIAVRYGWADFPVVNLWNKEGLPASPFRTDHFEMLTQPRVQTFAKK